MSSPGVVNTLAAPILEALVSHYELVALVRQYYELTEDPADTVRKGHVAEKLAGVLDMAVSTTFRERVSRAVRDAGWSRAKLARGIHYYCRMKEKRGG